MPSFSHYLPLAATLLLSGVAAQDTESDFWNACLPRDSNGAFIQNAPCFAMEAITAECGFGSTLNESAYDFPDTLPKSGGPWMTSPIADQRACFCQSSWFEQWEACSACVKLNNISLNETHEAYEAGLATPAASVISSFTSSYCAVTNTPAVQFGDAVYSAFNWPARGDTYANFVSKTINSNDVPAPTWTTFETALSAYYTPASRSNSQAAAVQIVPTQISSNFPTLATANGMIVQPDATAVSSYLKTASLTSSSSPSAATSASMTKTGAAPTGAAAGLTFVAGAAIAAVAMI